jgi:Holliday junction resolvase RusA-like endonuclease
VKQVDDALNTIVFRDHALIVEYGRLRKVHNEQPKLVVTIRPL